MSLVKYDFSHWKQAEGQMRTRWAEKVPTDPPLPEYPRPQLKRDEWLNLNGLWDYAIRSKNHTRITSYDGKILVPFPLESALSGVKGKIGHKQEIWYRRYFSIPEKWNGRKILLHFGAVDWEARILINGNHVGTHTGGYDPFTFEISEFLNNTNQNELIVVVWDPTDKGCQERGKQSLKPMIVFYTAVSGIWQTVWLEPVPETHISNISMIPDIDEQILRLFVEVTEPVSLQEEIKVQAKVIENETEIFSIKNSFEKQLILKIPNPKLWSPESPFLYDLKLELEKEDTVFDKIESYFGMRKISIRNDDNDIPRIELNNKQIFQYGLLDQGYWPDGLYTAPTDEALRYDIEFAKKCGFNLIRKHVKVEPARWYYHCDKLGMLVWQDMPNGGKFSYIFFRLFSQGRRKKAGRDNYYQELKALIKNLYNSPSIICWVPFNEGWGQFKTEKVVEMIKQHDVSRLINAASGWFDKKVGDIKDIHKYPGPKTPQIEKSRAAALGEFGGLGYKTKHTWIPRKVMRIKRIYWGFEHSTNEHEFFEKYSELIKKLKPMIKQGLCAAIYTQITDIEGEINGLITYDREIIKADPDKLKLLHIQLYE